MQYHAVGLFALALVSSPLAAARQAPSPLPASPPDCAAPQGPRNSTRSLQTPSTEWVRAWGVRIATATKFRWDGGTAITRVTVNAEATASDVELVTSSGNSDFDRIAVPWAKCIRGDGKHVGSAVVPVHFEL